MAELHRNILLAIRNRSRRRRIVWRRIGRWALRRDRYARRCRRLQDPFQDLNNLNVVCFLAQPADHIKLLAVQLAVAMQPRQSERSGVTNLAVTWVLSKLH